MKTNYFFSDSQIEQIREGALSILDEIGVKISRPELIVQLAKKGFRVDGDFVKIDKETARKKMDSQKPGAPSESIGKPRTLTTYISPYSHTFETIDGTFEPITTGSNLSMGEFAAKAAKIWPSLGASCPGHPTDIPPDVQFLRHTVNSVLCCEGYYPMEPVSLKIADYHFAICEAMNRPVRSLPVYVASPLNISSGSFDIALKYYKKVDEIAFSSMPSLGANTPLNLVGAYAQTIAENLGGAVIFEALTGVNTRYGMSIFTFDFRDMSMPFGTPEKLLLEWTNLELRARLTGGEFCGIDCTDIHTNAVRCGIQACVEKSSLATAGALLGSYIFYCSGTLGMDELFSPVQLLLDLEMLQHIQKIVNGMPKDDFDGDLIAEVREGLKSGYMMSDRTLDNLDRYVWQARLFTRKTFGAYMNNPFKIEIEKAKDLAGDIMKKPSIWRLDDKRAKEIEDIFAAALKSL